MQSFYNDGRNCYNDGLDCCNDVTKNVIIWHTQKCCNDDQNYKNDYRNWKLSDILVLQ